MPGNRPGDPLVNMSGWVMWVVNGIFENIGMVQDGLNTISQPLSVQDSSKATQLKVTQGEIRFDAIRFDYGGGRQVIDGLNLTIKPEKKLA